MRVEVPEYLHEVVATLSHLARSSPHVNQRSGVSVRLTVANSEVLLANATRRALRLGEKEVVPRVCDLEALAASTAGKIEIESLEEGRDEQIVANLVKAAVLTVFKEHFNLGSLLDVIGSFDDGRIVHAGDDVPSSTYAELAASIPALREHVATLTKDTDSPAAVASATEFILEGLHLSKRLNKDAAAGRSTYRSRG
jgi:magnesium chelatase subunit I